FSLTSGVRATTVRGPSSLLRGGYGITASRSHERRGGRTDIPPDRRADGDERRDGAPLQAGAGAERGVRGDAVRGAGGERGMDAQRARPDASRRREGPRSA